MKIMFGWPAAWANNAADSKTKRALMGCRFMVAWASQFLEHLCRFVLIQLLPFWSQNAVAVFLSAADIAQLVGRRRIVDIAVGVASYKRARVKRTLLDVEPDADGQFSRKRD